MVATVTITPMVHCPLKAMDGYILPQMGVGAIGVSIAVVLATVLTRCPVNVSALLVMLLFVYLMATTGWSTVSHGSAKDFPLVFLSAFGFIVATVLFENPANIVLLALAVFFSSNLLALYAIGQRFCFDPFFPERLKSQREHYKGKGPDVVPKPFWNKHFQDSRAISTIGNTNFATGYFLSAMPFLAYLTFEVSPWFALSLLPVIGAVVAADCRAGLLGLIAGALFFVLMLSKSGLPIDWAMQAGAWMGASNVGHGVGLMALIGCSLAVWHVAYGLAHSDKFKRILRTLGDETDKLNTMLDFEGKSDNSLEDRNHYIAHVRYRIRYWQAAWHLIKKKPLQGWGLRTYRREVYQAQGDLNMKDKGKFLGPAYQTPQPREVHNDFIENFVEGGLPYGLLFLTILGIVVYHAYSYGVGASPVQFIMVSAVMAGLVAFLVDVFFFFPLRLASSGLLFWVALAMIEGITGHVAAVQLEWNPLVTIFVAGALAAFLWETVIKPNAGNYFFSMYNFCTKGWKKEVFLNKALEMCPRETMFRTHMMIGYMNTFLDESSQHMEIIRQHYDGMIPAWAVDFNSGIIAMRNQQYEASVRHCEKSLFYLPTFSDSQMLHRQVWPKAPLKRRRIGMKQISQESLAKIQGIQQQIQALQAQLQQHDLSTHSIILAEKVRLSVPPEWAFNGEANQFVPPDKIPAGKKVVQVGPSALPIVVPENAQVIQQ